MATTAITAKLFQHRGSQAVRLPEAFRFEGNEVLIEKRGEDVILRPRYKPRPKPYLKTLRDVARYMAEKFPKGRDFPDIERLQEYDRRDLAW